MAFETVTPNQQWYPDSFPNPSRFTRLDIPLDVFMVGYNVDVSDSIVRHVFKEKAQKGGPQINYLPYSRAIVEFRKLHPTLEVCCLTNPATGGFLFKEIDDAGYFMRSYVTDGQARSEMYNFSILSSSGGPIYPGDKGLNSQTINKHYYRALVKAIALATGIGLKLWTLEDLDVEILDATLAKIARIKELAVQYRMATGNVYPLPDLSYMTPDLEITSTGKALAKAVKDAEEKAE